MGPEKCTSVLYFASKAKHVRYFTYFISFSLLFNGCREQEPDNEVFKYFPSMDLFEAGIVNKYYNHYVPDNPNQATRTNIFYIIYTKTGDSTYTEQEYNAGLQLSGYAEYTVSSDKVTVHSTYSVNRADTAHSKIINSVWQDWTGASQPTLVEEVDYPESRYRFLTKQIEIGDSTILNRPAKIIRSERKIVDLKQDSVVAHREMEHYYVNGFGYFGKESILEGGKFVTELVKQMPISKFRKLADHGRKRVGYIDPTTTLDESNDFELCDHELQIADYYNSDPDGRYAGGKQEMVNIIFEKLDRSKLHNESGYLTIRFVVNCKGEAGRFTTELSSLDYQEKEFNQETIRHLFDILYGLKTWRPVVIRDEARDAYFYITFKLKEGEIIDILP